jgi:hypothetical protein
MNHADHHAFREGDMDRESTEVSHSAEFWSMIEQRRKEPTVSWSQARAQLE